MLALMVCAAERISREQDLVVPYRHEARQERNETCWHELLGALRAIAHARQTPPVSGILGGGRGRKEAYQEAPAHGEDEKYRSTEGHALVVLYAIRERAAWCKPGEGGQRAVKDVHQLRPSRLPDPRPFEQRARSVST